MTFRCLYRCIKLITTQIYRESPKVEPYNYHIYSDSSPAPQNEIVSPDSAISELQAQPALDLQTEPEVQQENPIDSDPDYDKLVLTRGQDFDLDYTLLGTDSYLLVRVLSVDSSSGDASERKTAAGLERVRAW